MKAISVKLPWAKLIAQGMKTIETRRWSTKYRGPLLICASKRPAGPLAGMAVCTCRLVDCHMMTKGDESRALCKVYPDARAWVLADVRALTRPFPVTGRLGFFEVEIPEEAMFTIDTNLLETVSPLTAEFIDEYLAKKGNGGLSGIGKAVIACSKGHGINATYIVAHAAHETGWGTSRIAMEKNNLFGWSAFDASPYWSAQGFPSREECIEYVMGRIKELYLLPSGKYFRGAACLGSEPNGRYGMSVEYASDPLWGEKIAAIGRNIEAAFWERRDA